MHPLHSLVLQQFFRSFLQLEVFLKAKHILKVVLDDLGKHTIFKKLAGLHSIEQEIATQFFRKVGLDYLADLLLISDSLLHWGLGAIDKDDAIHV